MAPHAETPPSKWSSKFDTLRREKLFRNPPKDGTAYPALAEAFKPHVDSFNAVFGDDGLLHRCLEDIGVKEFLDGNPNDQDPDEPRNRLSLRIREYYLAKSVLPPSNKVSTTNREILPAECRERHSTYRGKFQVRLEAKLNDGEWKEMVRDMGHLPLMIRSNYCHLEPLSPEQLVNSKEESEEFGGYFIVNGIEKFIRFLIMPKRNYPLAVIRPSFTKRGASYTKYGVQLRSVRADETSMTNFLQYLDDGNIIFRFFWLKQEYLVPAMMIMKALVETNDREIFEGLIGNTDPQNLEEQQFVVDRIELLLRSYKVMDMHTKSKTRAYLGSRFKYVLGIADDVTDEEAGTEFCRRIVLPHLGSTTVTEAEDTDKFQMLLFMTRKLYALVQGSCSADNPDAASNQELLLPGSLYAMIIKERLDDWLNQIRIQCLEWSRNKNWKPFTDPEFWQDFQPKILKKTGEIIGRLVEYFLSTGNLSSRSGLDLQQTRGFVISAEKLNFYRFISHFRAVHRGSFFTELRTTDVRKLLPESWGFLCPVHTPDGAPCGLLNHLAHKCLISTTGVDVSAIPNLVAGFGVSTVSEGSLQNRMVVQLDGKILGYCNPKQARALCDTFRYWKVEGSHGIPTELEIGHIPPSKDGQYPGVYMASRASRMYRPVKYLPLDKLDYIGPFEQPFMSIACREEEIISGDSTHVEFDPTNVLSIVANMTPFSDFNQSPRNMYQCQMGKQSMGTPGTALRYRSDNKLYRLQSGQTPVVRPPLHNEYGLDNFPNGTNAVVAVISYTGYDMDDAMIINKSAHERGFAYGNVYKTKKLSLEEGFRRSRSTKTVSKLFGFAPGGIMKPEWTKRLDADGLPYVGLMVEEGDIIAASHKVAYDPGSGQLVNSDGRTELHRYKDEEKAFIEEVRLIGSEDGSAPAHTISIKFRIPRAPVIGDKFSSRHGQKGVCSQQWPETDMPFSESGIVPDVIINPHAFPSRMTIGMFIESLAGKAGCLHGFSQDATPFRFADSAGHRAAEYFGAQLRAAGYNYHGNEPMYSGISGTELHADIYLGVVYYQRLRHMVADKFQVRTTGPVNPQTGQPVKGRAKGGGIRVGEMERDALIAHGTAFLLQDRLLNCSDYERSWVCRTCGMFLGATVAAGGWSPRKAGGAAAAAAAETAAMRCRQCASKATGFEAKTEVWEDADGTKWIGGEDTTVVAVPGVLRYLDVELAAMGVKMKFTLQP